VPGLSAERGDMAMTNREYFCTECRDDPDRVVFASEDRDLVYEHITAEHEGVRPLLAMTTRVEREDT